MKTIFYFGMYDASDTEYYLSLGYRVVAVEANPALAHHGATRLASHIGRGELSIVNAAISSDGREVELSVSGEDLGSSSIYEEAVAARVPLGSLTVKGTTLRALFAECGVPHSLKVDIEGADHLCVAALTPELRPEYVSFETGAGFQPLLDHLVSIGYASFKLINQTNFRELTRERHLRDRLARKLIRMLGYAEPKLVQRHGRYFRLGHSSGPASWLSDGPWRNKDAVLELWRSTLSRGSPGIWYDLHACVPAPSF